MDIFSYSQAILVDRTVYLSGVLGVDTETNKLVQGGAVPEARQALTNMKHILEEAGSNLNQGMNFFVYSIQ